LFVCPLLHDHCYVLALLLAMLSIVVEFWWSYQYHAAKPCHDKPCYFSRKLAHVCWLLFVCWCLNVVLMLIITQWTNALLLNFKLHRIFHESCLSFCLCNVAWTLLNTLLFAMFCWISTDDSMWMMNAAVV
jgi:hypothetical protein